MRDEACVVERFDDVGLGSDGVSSNPARSDYPEPFLLMRNKKLDSEFYATYFNYDLSRCLDDCLNRDKFV
jgi:hypothetical protein